MVTTPKGLNAGGRRLWRGVLADCERLDYDLDAQQLATLEEACRLKDRCDALAPDAATGDTAALRGEREAALSMARLLAALRLPDRQTGKRPQRRQLRGAYAPSPVSSLSRARLVKEGKKHG